jgi:hypothetical protein
VHEADEPDALVNLLDADVLAGERLMAILREADRLQEIKKSGTRPDF